MNPQCARCGKVVYPTEKVNCLDKVLLRRGAEGRGGERRGGRAGRPVAKRRGGWRQVARTTPGTAALRPRRRRSSAQGGRRSPCHRADAGLAPSCAAAAVVTRRGNGARGGGESRQQRPPGTLPEGRS